MILSRTWDLNVDDKKSPKDCKGLGSFKNYKKRQGQPIISDVLPQCKLQSARQSMK